MTACTSKGAEESKPRPGELPDSRAEIEQSGLFDVSAIVQFDWEVSYTAVGGIRLDRTAHSFSVGYRSRISVAK
jgi:hypothetical protein